MVHGAAPGLAAESKGKEELPQSVAGAAAAGGEPPASSALAVAPVAAPGDSVASAVWGDQPNYMYSPGSKPVGILEMLGDKQIEGKCGCFW